MTAFSSRRRRWLVAATVLALTLATAAAHADPAKELRIGFQKSASLLVLQKTQGTLEKRLAPQGVTVKWVEFPAGPQLLEGLNVGAVDIGYVGEAPPIFAQAAGARFVYVGNDPAAPATEALVVQKDSPLKSVADLKGKRVALNKGSNVHYLLVKAAREGRPEVHGHHAPCSCRRQTPAPRSRRAPSTPGSSGIRSSPPPNISWARASWPTAPGIVNSFSFYLAQTDYRVKANPER